MTDSTAVRTSWSAPDLMALTFPEPRWAVPGIVSEGLNLLVSPPKTGKSWMSLNLAVAISSGGMALGRIPVEGGSVLYLALEDTPRRLQQRMRTVLGAEPPPPALTFVNACPTLDEGGDTMIAGWLKHHADARLVIIDVFAKIRGTSSSRSGSAYEADYQATGAIKRLADDSGVAMLVVHHTRKAAADDFLATVSGTNGIAGSADTLLVLSRSRTTADAMLQITGRDVEEAEHAMKFDAANGQWSLLEGPASDYGLGDTRKAILDYLREMGAGTPKDIAEDLKLSRDLVRKTLNQMAKDGQIDTDGHGLYMSLDGVTPVPAVTEGIW